MSVFEPGCQSNQDIDDPHFTNLRKDGNQLLSTIESIFQYLISLIVRLLPLLVSILVVYFVVEKFTFGHMLLAVLLAFLIYVMVDNMNGENLPGSLPASTYPIPPHLGLDGVRLENRSCPDCF